MREIKFRAWDGKNIINDVFEAERMNSIHIGKYYSPRYKHGTFESLMQFTGLTDKNGVDIYEGDILTDHIGKGVVEYKERYAAFRIKYAKPNAGRGKWFLDYNLRGERESLEVIGNIHQNSELLK